MYNQLGMQVPYIASIATVNIQDWYGSKTE